MTRGTSPWDDPAVDAGFAAAYAPVDGGGLLLQDAAAVDGAAVVDDPVQVDNVQVDNAVRRERRPLPRVPRVAPAPVLPVPPVPTPQDELDEAADAAARPITRTGRRARAPQPGRLSPARAVAGAAVSVAGVLLGIGTLLWLSNDPAQGPGPVVQVPPAQSTAEQPAAEQPAATDPVADEPAAVAAPVAPPAPAPAQVAAPSAAAPPPPAAPPVLPVTVLNNSRRDGLAALGAARFRAGGWPVAATGNFRGKIPVTTVYYEPGQAASARSFAERFDGIVRVRPRFATLPARGLVVVLTREYAA